LWLMRKQKSFGVLPFMIRAILVMASFIFVACEKSTGEIGLEEVIDSQAFLGIKKNVPILAYTAPFDSIVTKGAAREISGAYIDPVFGKVKAAFNTHLLLSLLNPDFGSAPICDSVVMLIAYDGYYADTSAPVTFVVNELGEYLDPDTTYHSNYVFDLGVELGRITTIPRPNTSIYDQGKLVSPSLKLKLDKSYFQSQLINASRLARQFFGTNEEFITHMYGFQLSTEGFGSGLSYFDIANLASLVRVYYRESAADTVAKSYEMYYGIFSSGNYVSVNSFEQDHSIASFDLNMQDTVNGEATLYVQAMGGVCARLELPDMKMYADSGFIINKAELIVPVREGSVGRFLPPNQLLLLEDKGDVKQLVENRRFFNGQFYGSPTGGAIVYGDLRSKKYTFLITRLVNQHINSTDTLYPLLLIPASSASQGWRVVLNGIHDPYEPMEFNIYYTKTKK
jgi:hypothetical protein